MRKPVTFTLLLLVAALLTALPASAQDAPKDWKTFSRALVKAVRSPNQGVRQAALQHIVQYGDSLNVQSAVFDVARIYRSRKNDENTRVLALVALSRMKNAWAMDFLARSAHFEKSARVRRHTLAVLHEAAQADGAPTTPLASRVRY